MKQFYVYIFFDPRNQEAFYVGKGFGWRYKRHLKLTGPNKHLKNRIIAIRADGLEPIVTPYLTVDENTAFQMERELIQAFGRRDLGTGSLCNYTDGGEGSSGRKGFSHSTETKARIREKLIGRVMTEEHKTRIGQSRKGHVNGPESFVKAAETRKKNLTDERRKELSDRAKQAMTSERLTRMTELARIKNLGSKDSEETRAKKREAFKNRVVSDQARENMRLGQLRRQQEARQKCGR